ncbi:MAG: hypothetical protein FWC27_14150 [Firmicutes bacterium]|nr:hypothetical protein [Bacillota bacterium]
MKRLLALALCLVLGLGCMTAAYATEFSSANDPPTQTRMAYVSNTITSITISGGKANCLGDLTGYKGITTKVEITLTLQRKLATSNTWTDYYNHPKQTFINYYGTASFSKDIVKGYQYRTKAVYTAWAGTKYETFTEYSGAVSY